MEETKFKFPTEIVELPSKGLLYPEGHPLSEGTVEIKYMTAKEEDILTNQSYIKNGTVLDKIMKSLIVSKINYDDLLIGDKNAILVASRILGYGSEYTFDYLGESHTVDLSTIENKPLKEELTRISKNITDKAVQIKLQEVLPLIVEIEKNQPIKNENIVDLLQYCELVEELKAANGQSNK